ncbi:hypothetical protein B9Z55_026202 [Caenorhabditis nigoni]|uniref:Uncharacterized protein n=2 Tax=Caenorhabditis nigoni TaxID=1611254 RepID=A0A2G5T226_9PELO|nr:hypothetical protein B9Z55_026202 [Caenorhabditis nigoni]
MLSSLVQPKDDLRQKLNDKFFEELANLRYGDNSEEKQKYDNIGEKFVFWKSLSDAQKKMCIVDPSSTIRSKRWNVSSGIEISDEEKMEFLKQRRPLHEITCRSLLERLLKASETDKARLVPIEKPLANAFAAFPLYFDQFHCATLSVPESDIFIKGWFDRKHAELRNKTFGNQHTAQEGTSETGDIQDHPAASLVIDVQKRRHQILNRNYLRDMQAFAKHLGAFQQKPMGGNVSGIVPNSVSSANSIGNVPHVQNPINAIQVSVENQATQKTSVSDDGQSSPEIVFVNITHPDSIGNRSVSQSQRAALIPKVPATIFHPTRPNELQDSDRPENSVMNGRRLEGSRIKTNARKRSLSSIEESVKRDGGEHLPINVPSYPTGIDYDAPQVPATSSNTRVEENLATNSSRRKQSAPKKSRIDQSANETEKETGCVSGDAPRTILPMNSRMEKAGNISQPFQPQRAPTVSRDILAGILGKKKKLSTIAETVKLGTLQFWNQDSSRIPSTSTVNCRREPLIRSSAQQEVAAPTVRRDVLAEKVTARSSNPVFTNRIQDSVRDGMDTSSNMSAASSSSLPISMPADNVTHEAALSIAPPPRMVSSIMNHLATQLKKREENGCLDFSEIEVNLKVTGKELNDTLFFLKNLTAQVETAKQGGSFQQL